MNGQHHTRVWARPQFTPSQVLVLGFAGIILLGAILLWLPISAEPGQHTPFIDALFTATSAVCVTGLTVFDTAKHFSPFGEVVIMLLIQAGGLGIMTLSALAMLLVGKRVSLRDRLLMQEALGSFTIAGVVRITRNILLVTVAVESLGALLLAVRWAAEMPFGKALYWGVFHSVSAFNNAGFDITSVSLRDYNRDPSVLFIISTLIILGGIGFLVLEDLWRHRRWSKLSLHSRLALKVTGLLLVVGTFAFLALEYTNPATFAPLPWYHKLTNAYFASVTPRTAGFESVLTGGMRDATLFFTIILMFIGASPGGTGGGIKTTTFSLIALTIRSTVTGKEHAELMGRRLPGELVDKAIAVAAIALGLVATTVGLLLITEARSLADPNSGMTFIRLVFEDVSAFGTVGLSTGITALLSSAGKLIITITMYIGRVGPLTMAVALAQRKVDRTPIYYPEDRVMIG